MPFPPALVGGKARMSQGKHPKKRHWRAAGHLSPSSALPIPHALGAVVSAALPSSLLPLAPREPQAEPGTRPASSVLAARSCATRASPRPTVTRQEGALGELSKWGHPSPSLTSLTPSRCCPGLQRNSAQTLRCPVSSLAAPSQKKDSSLVNQENSAIGFLH